MHINDKISLGQHFDMFSSTPEQVEGKAAEWEAQGDLEQSQGQYDMAINWYSLALTLEPENIEVLLKKAKMLLRVEEPRAASTVLKDVLKLRKSSAAALYLQGLAFARRGMAGKAQELANCFSGDQDLLKQDILKDVNDFQSPYISKIPAIGTAEEVSQMMDEQFMIDSWHLNKWWYTPIALQIPTPTTDLSAYSIAIIGINSFRKVNQILPIMLRNTSQ